MGATSPNPAVGAVIVREGRTLGEGWHRRAGEAHAEVEALRDARERGHDVHGAEMVVTLEPCAHHGRTPPCADAVIAAGIAGVTIGTTDPNPRTNANGIARLRDAGVDVTVVDDPRARELIELFAGTVASPYPFVTLKMAASLDGYVAPSPGRYAVTGPQAFEYVRDLRSMHDAVMVGAGTVRIDDPLLTVRPHRVRQRPYVRVIVCETDPVDARSRIFADPNAAPAGAYRPTIVLAPAGRRRAFAALETVADVVYAGAEDALALDLDAALRALRARDVMTVLCEGGPTLAARLLAARLVDRVVWLVAPLFLHTEDAVPVLRGADLHGLPRDWHFDRVERAGDDVILSGRLARV